MANVRPLARRVQCTWGTASVNAQFADMDGPFALWCGWWLCGAESSQRRAGANTFAPAKRASPNGSIAPGSSLPWAEGTHFVVVSHAPTPSEYIITSSSSLRPSPPLPYKYCASSLVLRPPCFLLLVPACNFAVALLFVRRTPPCPLHFLVPLCRPRILLYICFVVHCPRRRLSPPHSASRARYVRNRLARNHFIDRLLRDDYTSLTDEPAITPSIFLLHPRRISYPIPTQERAGCWLALHSPSLTQSKEDHSHHLARRETLPPHPPPLYIIYISGLALRLFGALSPFIHLSICSPPVDRSVDCRGCDSHTIFLAPATHHHTISVTHLG